MKKYSSNHDLCNQAGQITRRKFIGLLGIGATALTSPGLGSFEISSNEWQRWQKNVLSANVRRVYSSGKHTDARMHLGGIGTGNFEIGADGQLTTWQLFNTLRDGKVPFYFVIKVGTTSKLLQTQGGPDWPRIESINMVGEYPIAELEFRDRDLPVKIELSSFTPFAPLDTASSSMPLAVFRFRVTNFSQKPQTVSLASILTNPVGYASMGDIQDCAHPSFGHNVNEVFSQGKGSGFFLRALAGEDPTLDRPVSIYLLEDVFIKPPDPDVGFKNYACSYPEEIALPPLDRPERLKIRTVKQALFDASTLPDPQNSIIWLEDAPIDLSCRLLKEFEKAVMLGFTLVFSGKKLPLLRAYAALTKGEKVANSAIRADVVFEDFESGYEKWTIKGEAFGREPAHGGFGNQQAISGFLGKGFANSYLDGDRLTGKLISKAFIIERRFIRFLIGGGRSETTQVRLVMDGNAVRSTSGDDNEKLIPKIWDVMELVGKKAHLEIVDASVSGWGHISADEIVFTDWPGEAEVPAILETLLPLRFSAIDESDSRVKFKNYVFNSPNEETGRRLGMDLFTRHVGTGKVVLVGGQVFNPAHSYSTSERQNAYSFLCSIVKAQYKTTQGQSSKEPGFGTVALAAMGGNITGKAELGSLDAAWKQFRQDGNFEEIKSLVASKPTVSGTTSLCAISSTVVIPAGEQIEIPFLFAWHYPNKYGEGGDWMGCHYATKWPNALAVIRDALENYDELWAGTDRFRQTFYKSTLPYWLLDCITANAAITRHIGVVFQIANGDIFGWEGSNGSCQPTCTHVWGYSQSLARLFPELERKMRAIDYLHQQNTDGSVNNRTDVPSPPHPTNEHAFTDGHCSCILKAYREALNSTDDSFFAEYWPHVKRAIEYLISRDAKDSGGVPSGVLQDDQWNTYDEALHGITSFISGYYLAALRAAEEWSKRMNDMATADKLHQIFRTGQKRIMETCWNGEFFQQYLPDYLQRPGEVGPGCMADQLIGQWWAHQLGLGYILPEESVVSALRSIFKNNWKDDLTGWKHSPRAFAGAGDQGLINCTWPLEGRPKSVLLYSDEVWSGVEYQVAAHMIYEGLIEEGFSIVRGARDRYDGVPRPPIGRNPWSEIECGGHYARAMSSWSLLLAVSGFLYNGPDKVLSFDPRLNPDDFSCFFSASEGWGRFEQKSEGSLKQIKISVEFGRLHVKQIQLNFRGGILNQPIVTLSNHKVPIVASIVDGKCDIAFQGDGIIVNKNQSILVAV